MCCIFRPRLVFFSCVIRPPSLFYCFWLWWWNCYNCRYKLVSFIRLFVQIFFICICTAFSACSAYIYDLLTRMNFRLQCPIKANVSHSLRPSVNLHRSFAFSFALSRQSRIDTLFALLDTQFQFKVIFYLFMRVCIGC